MRCRQFQSPHAGWPALADSLAAEPTLPPALAEFERRRRAQRHPLIEILAGQRGSLWHRARIPS